MLSMLLLFCFFDQGGVIDVSLRKKMSTNHACYLLVIRSNGSLVMNSSTVFSLSMFIILLYFRSATNTREVGVS